MDASVLLGLGLAWLLLQVGALLFVLLRVRVRPLTRERISFDALPPYLVALLLPECEALVRAGFELVGPVAVCDFDHGAPRLGYQLVHREDRIHAYVRAGVTPDRARPVLVVLESYLARGAAGPVVLATLDARHTDAFASARCITHYVDASDPIALLEAHRARRDELGSAPLVLADDDVLAVSAEGWSAWIDEALARRSWTAAPEPGCVRMTTWTALRQAFVRRFDPASRGRLLKQLRASASEAPPPVEEEIDGLRRADALLSRPIARGQAIGFSLVGALLFVGWFGLDDWATALVLTATVLFHELGHAAAMRLVGYRDVRIYFVPFMGGATSGAKRDASLHHEVIVLLAGPVPGILVGTALLGVVWSAALPDIRLLGLTAAMLLGINYLNLLPVFPLDGGRIVHRLVAGRAPVLELLVRVVAIVLLAASAFAGLGALTGFLALLLALGARTAWRTARLERALRRAGAGALAPDARLAAIFGALDGIRGWPARFGIARQLLLRLEAPDASWLARLGWACVYLACLVPLGLAAVWWWSIGGLAPREPRYTATDREVACDGGPVTLDAGATVVVCIGPNVALDRVEDLLVTEPALLEWCLRPPWGAPPTPDEARGRSTVVSLQERYADAIRAELRADTAVDPRVSAERYAEASEHARTTVAASIASRRGAPDFDETTADLWLSGAGADVIGARVGGDCAVAYPVLDEGDDRVALRVPARATDLDAAGAWLCAQGCERVGTSHAMLPSAD